MASDTLFHQLVKELWLGNDTDCIPRLFAPDCVIHGPTGDIHGPEGFLEQYQILSAAFETIDMHIPYAIQEGDYCMARFELKQRHVGEFMGLAATQKEIFLTGNSFGRISNGQFQEGWDEFNLFGLMMQLGIIPTP